MHHSVALAVEDEVAQEVLGNEERGIKQ